MGKERLGFRPCRSDGSPAVVSSRPFYWAGTSTCNMWDVVALDANGFANYLGVETGTNILGVVVGMEPVAKQDLTNAAGAGVSFSGMTAPDLNRRRLSSAGYVRVVTDRRQFFRACANGAMSTVNIGQTTNIYLGADPTAANIGQSGHFLLASQVGTSNLGAFKIVGIPRDPDRYANECIVHLNRMQLDADGGTGGGI